MADKQALFEKLNNHNYMMWSFKMKMVLIKEEVWDVVAGEAEEAGGDQEDAAAAAVANQGRQMKALALISLMVENDQLVLLRNAQTGREAWNTLRQYHQRNTLSNRIRVMKKIFESELTVGGSMQDHLQKLSEYFAELQDMWMLH